MIAKTHADTIQFVFGDVIVVDIEALDIRLRRKSISTCVTQTTLYCFMQIIRPDHHGKNEETRKSRNDAS